MRTLNTLFDDCVEKYRDNVYLLENSGDGYQPTTYSEARTQVHRFAAGLLSLGIRKGDVIVEVNRQPVTSVGEVKENISKSKKKDQLLLLVQRKGGKMYVPLEQQG